MIYIQCGIVILSLILSHPQISNKFNNQKLKKWLSIILAIVFFIRYMSGDDAISDIIGLESGAFDDKWLNFVSLILNWWIISAVLIIILNSFFYSRVLINIIRFFVFPLSILAIIFIKVVSIGIVGYLGYATYNFRSTLIAIELAIMLIYSIKILQENNYFRIKKEESKGLFYIIPILLFSMPIYTIQGLFGLANIATEIKGFSQPHRIILYLSLIVPIVIFLIARKKSHEHKKLILLYISLATLITFSFGHKFASFSDITQWPFHLCNTAMYIIPLCLIFKWEKLFYFTYFINVIGAFLAMIMPNYSSSVNLFESSLINFYVNHFIAFFLPILMVALGIYARPNLKKFIYSIIGFLGYFILVLILNAWFSNYASVDYFFVNSDFIADKLGLWAENLRNVTLEFNIGELKFVFYPVYQTLFFFVYTLLGAGMWYIYEWIYDIVDNLYLIADKRKKYNQDIIELREYMKKHPIENKINLKLNNFSKKYGSSDVFAVKNANLEIFGGEIFGFLGPNGAGKSSIIKSIVGIQPITSGNITVCGYDVGKQSIEAKKLIGFVPDHYALYEKLTGREYINYIADIYDVSEKDRNDRIEKYIRMFQLETAIDNQMRTYSHGMKQKITIMSALVHNPKVWILDEPLTGLDPNSIFQVKECMREHAKNGNIVFFSSHIIDVVERICDRIGIIKKGKIILSKKVSDIEKKSTLEKFYMDTINNG